MFEGSRKVILDLDEIEELLPINCSSFYYFYTDDEHWVSYELQVSTIATLDAFQKDIF